MRTIANFLVCTLTTLLALASPSGLLAADLLPKPDYARQPSDPEWLARVVQFHGHLGPAVVAGARMGMIGLRAIEAEGYFDVEVTCEGPMAKPPQSCFLDGLQVATGATLGKRTLHWVYAEEIVVRIKHTRTGKTAELRPTPALLELLASFQSKPMVGAGHGADERLEMIARRIARLAEKDVAQVKVSSPALRVPEAIERGMKAGAVEQKQRMQKLLPALDPLNPRPAPPRKHE